MGKKTISDEKKAIVKTLADAGVPYRKIKEVTSVSLGHISNIIKEFENNRKLVEYYKKNRADLLAFDQLTYRSYITKEKLEKASARDLELMRGITYDKERLTRGESTENIHHLIEYLDDLQRRRHEARRNGEDRD